MIDAPAVEAVSAAILQGAELARLGRALPESFDVSLITSAGTITAHCDAVLRFCPVAGSSRGRSPTVAPCSPNSSSDAGFGGRMGGARPRRVREGGVATPESSRGTMAGGGEALLFEFLENATPRRA